MFVQMRRTFFSILRKYLKRFLIIHIHILNFHAIMQVIKFYAIMNTDEIHNYPQKGKLGMFKIIILLAIASIVISLLTYAFRHKSSGNLQQVNLLTPSDRAYEIPTTEKAQTEQTRKAVESTTRTVQIRAHINPEWFDKIADAYAQGYVLYRNATAENVNSRSFPYLKSLHKRSSQAAGILQTAEKECQRAISALHKCNGSQNTIKSISRYQSMLTKLRINTWHNNHKLKLLIRDSGAQGRKWYTEHEKKRKERYGK